MHLGKVQNLTRRSNAESCQNFLIKLKKCWQIFQDFLEVFQESFAQDNNVVGFFGKVVCSVTIEKQRPDLLKYSSLAMNPKGKQILQETVQS